MLLHNKWILFIGFSDEQFFLDQTHDQEAPAATNNSKQSQQEYGLDPADPSLWLLFEAVQVAEASLPGITAVVGAAAIASLAQLKRASTAGVTTQVRQVRG